MLNFRKPLTRNWSCCANFYNYFILRTNYDRTCEDHLFFSRIVDFFLIHEIIHARYSKEKKRKKKKTSEHIRKRVVSRKISKECLFYFELDIGRLSPSRWKSSPRIPYFCLVRKCTGGNEFSTRSNRRER